MSKTIDQKVVEMRFDNAQFEKGVAQSEASIEGLKKSLNFSTTNADLSSPLFIFSVIFTLSFLITKELLRDELSYLPIIPPRELPP